MNYQLNRPVNNLQSYFDYCIASQDDLAFKLLCHQSKDLAMRDLSLKNINYIRVHQNRIEVILNSDRHE